MEKLIREMLIQLGEDPDREGLLKTPQRVTRAFDFLMGGYRSSPAEILEGAIFEEDNDEMVVVRDITLFSMCEHHLLPFYGKCHVGYIPRGRIVGLSKIPRVVDVFARRLQVQERLTRQIADCLYQYLEPQGVAVIVEALHLCMAMRGVEKQDAHAVTSSMRGVFRDNPSTRAEFLDHVGMRRRIS